MNKAFLLLLLLLLAGLLSGCFSGGATETETGTAQLTGDVKWSDGRPAVGARVQLRSLDFLPGLDSTPSGTILRDTVTNASGRFSFDRVPVGEYQVEVLYSEGYGAAGRIKVESLAERKVLAPLVLRSIVNVTGRVAFSDSSRGPAKVHVLGTGHWALADSATGRFALREMPPGTFDLRVTTTMPFFPAKDFPGRTVEGPASLDVGDLVLEKAAKQGYALEGGRLTLAGIDGSNPVLYDNDFGRNTWDNEILWALVSSGRLDLRGSLATLVQGPAQVAAEMSSWAYEIRLARLAGMRNIPDPILGASRRLSLPPSGRWQEISPESNPGIQVVIAEARKASAEKPLVVVAGGELTTVANAVLLDPSIADKMVVFGVYNQGANAKDTLAAFVVARTCRFVAWGRDYFWSDPGPAAAPLPGNWLGLQLKASRDSSTVPQLFFADFAALAFLADGRSWTTARSAQAVAPPLKATLGAAGPGDFVDIPKEANDWALMDKLFFSILADSGAYHPWPVTGPIAGVSFRAMSGVAVDSVAGEGDIVTEIGTGDWVDYAVESAADEDYDLVLRYRGLTAGKAQVGGQDVDLPAGTGWREARTRISLKKGAQTVRLATVGGSWQLSRLQWESIP